MTWIDFLWLVANIMLVASSLMCLGKLISRGTTHVLTRLSYTVTPVGSGIAVAGFLQHNQNAVYAGTMLEVLGMLIISVRIYYYLSLQENGKHGAYIGKERRRPLEEHPLSLSRGRRSARR